MKPDRRKTPFFPGMETDETQDDWLMSYSDMMTLLFAFFALLLSLSTIDPVKMQLVTKSMDEAMGGVSTEPVVSLAKIQADLEKIVREKGLTSKVAVSRDKHGVALSLRGSSFFASGSSELLPSSQQFLAMVGALIERIPYQIAIEGHTDNVPICTPYFESNWELSSARASQVVRFFINRGLDSRRFRAVGYADTKPVNVGIGNRTAEARAKNRRVVILFLDEIR